MSKPVKIVECGSCSCFHRWDYHGDCRNDDERFPSVEEAADLLRQPVVEMYEDGIVDVEIHYPKPVLLTTEEQV